MTRIATYQGAQSTLLNLQRAQSREAAAGEAFSSGYKGSDFKAFGRSAESVVALKSVQTRVEGWLEQADGLYGRLEMQDLMLNRTIDAGTDARAAITDALANDRGDGLVAALGAAFSKAVDAINAKHEGKPLFAGARLSETPFDATALSDLTAVPAASDLFNNDQLKASTRLGETTVLQTGELASEVAGGLMARFREFQAFVEGPDGNFGHPLTAAQKTFLQGAIVGFADEASAVTDVAARNGAVQRRLEDAQADLGSRSLSLKGLIGDRIEVDPAAAITELQAAQLAVQATAKVFTTLQGSSLLALLAP